MINFILGMLAIYTINTIYLILDINIFKNDRLSLAGPMVYCGPYVWLWNGTILTILKIRERKENKDE